MNYERKGACRNYCKHCCSARINLLCRVVCGARSSAAEEEEEADAEAKLK